LKGKWDGQADRWDKMGLLTRRTEWVKNNIMIIIMDVDSKHVESCLADMI